MADIGIERKGPSIWPWIAGLAAVIAVIWIWAAATGPEMDQTDPATTAERAVAPGVPGTPVATTGSAPGAIREYVQFAEERVESAGEMGREHEYTADGIRRLSAALESLVDEKPGTDSRERLDRFREIADRIEKDPASDRHSALVREAFTKAVDVIDSVDGARATGNLRSTAQSIQADQPLLDQRDKVRTFFRQSADAIESAARG